MPLHWFFWQSPAVCIDTGAPAAANVKPQVFITHERVAQSVSVPAHWLAALHATHAPRPSQYLPPFCMHATSTINGVISGVPFEHDSAVQSLLSVGTSV